MAKSKGRLLSELAEAPKNEDYSDVNALPNTGNKVGDQAFVEATDRLYIWNGSGWYNIALINTTPTWDSGGQPAGSYVLDADSPQTATTITLAASDPEGIPISYTYVTSGQMDSISTISQDSSVFTITPKTSAQAPDGGTGSITFRASDGINILPQVSSFTLSFITTIENSRYTTLLATATGTSDNNNITDSSTNNHNITVSGDAHAGTFSPYRSGGYSMYFDGGDYVDLGNGNLAINTEDFTIETWVNVTIGSNMLIATNSNWNSGDNTGWRLFIAPSGIINLTASQGSWNNYPSIYASTNTISSNEWVHIVVCRNSGVISSYINGIKDSTTVNYSASLNQFGGSSLSSYSLIGAYIADGGTYNTLTGYLSDFHFKLGSAKYTTTFSPPTERLTVESGTDVLLFNKPFLKDESTNAYTTTISGDPKISPFSPYDYIEYSATDHGGSINFDGTGDYLTIPDHSSLNFASNDWTIECWIYPKTNVGFCGIWHQSASGTDWYSIYLNGSFNPKFVFYNSSNGIEWAGTAAANTAPQNTWTHVALVRQFGTGVYLYANGKLVASDTLDASVTMLDKTYNHVIGYERFVGSGNAFDGLISDFKMDIGTAHYTGEFTPPTAPLSSTGAELHIKGTDASIIDKSQGANLKLVGNTTGSTTQAKFSNTKSMYFDGIDDHIVGPTVSDLNIGTGDFTAECWVYETSLNTNKGIWDGRSTGLTTDGFTFTRIHTDAFRIWSGSALITTDPVTIQNTWVHCAVVRYNGTLTIYINGSSSGTPVSNSTNFSNSGTFIIGAGRHSTTATPNAFITGYIQDLRVSNFARYTANFTPPTASLEG